ncbi:hypothetical protein ACH5RR_016688 [Cinchona calisaya]|uniref:C2H2-type domain-containing protein n=1 Tax=Cinchona calisaya TaxID=153742 RepID=A0ABD2ZWQ4_9GENT
MELNMQFLMWLKSKQILVNSHFQGSLNSLNTAWEERAFAEDAAGPFGGFIWPPRSYSCTFCRREFRSAQALGGHMNVHRWDRARLKQSLSTEGGRGDSPGRSNGCRSFSPLSSPYSSRASVTVTSHDENSIEDIVPFSGVGKSTRKEELMVTLEHDDDGVETKLQYLVSAKTIDGLTKMVLHRYRELAIYGGN